MIPFNSYFKNILAKYPRLDNNEVISGIYTFLNTIKIKHPNAHLGTYPSTDTTYHKVSILDENNRILGDISFKAYSNGNYGIVFSLNNREFAIKVSDEGHIDLRCDYPLCGFNTGTDEVANTKYVLDVIDYKNDLLNNSIREYIISALNDINQRIADVIRYSPQTLTTAQKQQARENIGVDGFDGVPIGTIVMWSGGPSTIPDGWEVCDGTKGTPNLTGRFVIGRSYDYPLNTFGGSTDHFHYFGYHSGDNCGNFYINGDIPGEWSRSNCPKAMKAPSKASIINTLKDPNPEYIESQINAKSVHWNGDNGGGISDGNFVRGNLITTTGYGVSADDTLKDCMPPYWSLYYIMKVRRGSTSNGGTAASASQVERLSDLISQLQTRITALESSSSSSGSSSGGSSSPTLLVNVPLK